MSVKEYKIILADDHEIFLDSLSAMLSSQEEFNIIAKAVNGKELMDCIMGNIPDLCIVDLEMPELNGFEAIEKLQNLFPTLKIIVLSMYADKSLIAKIMKLGVKGYLPKTCDKEELIFAMKRILNGKTYFSDNIIKILTDTKINHTAKSTPVSVISTLSVREKEIIKLICQGLSNKRIANKLFISQKTVDNHRTNIMQKLSVHNVVELVRFCLKNGLAE